jgi:hypothetical protein
MGPLIAAIALAASLLQPPAARPHLPAEATARHLAITATAPRLLYQVPRGTIAAFAQDGSVVAWFVASTKGCNVVHVRSLVNGAQWALPDESSGAVNVTCAWEVAPPVGLTLAGSDVLWTLHQRPTPGVIPFDYVLGAGVTDSRERRFQEIAHSGHGAGLWLGGIAGDSVGAKTTLAYAVTSVGYVDEVACLARKSCDMKILGGGIHLVSGRRDTPIAAAPPSVAIAVSGTSLAYVPAAGLASDGRPIADAATPIDVLDTESGDVVASATPAGTPLAIALSTAALATLEQTPLGLRIAWYSTDSGTLMGSVPVPATTVPALTANDQMIVFRVGRELRAVAIATSHVKTIATLPFTPIGLSLEGNRLAWAENVNGRGRIRALTVTAAG